MTNATASRRSGSRPRARLAALVAVAITVALASLPARAGAAAPGAPEVYDGSLQVAIGGSVTMDLYSSDAPAGSTATFEIVTPPAHGDLVRSAPMCTAGECTETVTYTPQGATDDSFAYTATDQDGNDSDPATVTIDVYDPEVPMATTSSADVAMDVSTVVTLDGFGPAGAALRFEIVDQPRVGGLGTPGAADCRADGGCTSSVTYTPPAQGPGQGTTDGVSFTYRVTNAARAKSSAPATVGLSFNARPTAGRDTLPAVSGAAAETNVLANDLDPDGDDLVVTARTAAAHGTVSCTSSTCTYTSAPGYVGPDAFTYTISDQRPGGTATGTVQVEVTAAPVPSTPPVTPTPAAPAPPAPAPPAVTRPGTPGIGQASAGKRRGTKTGVARWRAPASTGGATITAYVVRAYKYKGRKLLRSKSVTVAGNRRSHDMVLGAGKWRFRVAAVNSAGSGALSGLSNLVKAK